VAWWPFEGNGLDIINGNSLTLVGNPAFVLGEVGQALSFDGSDDAAFAAPSASLNVGTGVGLTLEGWINPTDPSQLQPLLEWNDNLGNIGAHLWMSVDTAAAGDGIGDLFANLVDTSGNSHQVRTAADLLNVNTWQHIALTYDNATGQAVLYYNGVAAGQSSVGSFTPQTSFPLYFGLRPSGFFSGIRFSGAQDEISLYDRALSASEIQSIFTQGAAGKCGTSVPPPTMPPHCTPPGIAAWWPFDGNALDAISGSPLSLLGSPVFVPGEVSQALRFDGVDDSAAAAASAALDIGAARGLTIEGWINPADLSQLRPVLEWNDNKGNIGAHLWVSVDTAAPGDGIQDLFANLVDTSGNSHQIRTSAGLLQINQWQHIGITYNKVTGQAVLYHNGAAAAQANLGSFTPQTSFPLAFGLRPSGPFSGIRFFGAEDEISLYSRALGAGEIRHIFNQGAAGKCGSAGP